MACHLRLGVIGLTSDKVGKIRQVMAIVDKPGDKLYFVLEYEHGRVAAVCWHAADESRREIQLNFSGLCGTGLVLLTFPPYLRHQPGQHGQRGPPVQRRPAHVPERKPFVCLLITVVITFAILSLHLSKGSGTKTISALCNNSVPLHR